MRHIVPLQGHVVPLRERVAGLAVRAGVCGDEQHCGNEWHETGAFGDNHIRLRLCSALTQVVQAGLSVIAAVTVLKIRQ